MSVLFKNFAANFFVKITKILFFLFFTSIPAATTFAQNYAPNTFSDPAISSVNNATGEINGGATISLRSALMAADNLGGTHTIALGTGTYLINGSGTYTVPSQGTFNSRTIFLGNSAQDITINGNGPSNTIISMDAAGKDRIFAINYDGTTPDGVFTTISGVKFTNGYLAYDTYGGAAIYAGPATGDPETLAISNCVFENNICPGAGGSGGNGGAIYMFQGVLTIDQTTFTNNQSIDGAGGAIYYTLYNNTGSSGLINITNSVFTGNTARADGGAISFVAQSLLQPGQLFSADIKKNTFLNNTATGYGGAIAADNAAAVSIPNINYNRFVGNTSMASASTSGLFFVYSGGSVNAENNWWGCNTGPAAAGTCDKAGGIGVPGTGILDADPWLQLKVTALPATICNTNTSTVTASFLKNSDNTMISLGNLSALIGLPVIWSSTLGTLGAPQDLSIQSSGEAINTFTSNGTGGTATANARVDNIPGSETTPARADITVNTSSTPPTGATGVTTICNGNNTTLTVSGGLKGTGAVTEWFTGSCGSTPAGTGDAITVSPAITTTYFVRYNGPCNTTACATVTVTVNTSSTAPTGATGITSICNGGNTMLTVSGGSKGTGAVTEWFTGSCGTTPAGTGDAITVSPVTTTNYFVRYNGTCNTTACATVTVTVNQLPSVNAPTVIQPTCAMPTGTVTVNATGSGTLEYALNGGPFQVSNVFSGLAPGNYDISVRSQSAPVCVSSYSGNPVILMAATGCCVPAAITNPGNQSVNTSSNSCTAIVNYTATVTGTPAPAVTYNFSGATNASGFGDGSGSVFNKGNTTVILTATNSCFTATANFVVTVSDNQLPAISCPGNISINTSSNKVLLASYPLQANLTDAASNFSPVVLEGSPTPPVAPSAGNPLCQNGIYKFCQCTGWQNIQTPSINTLNTSDFSVRIGFRYNATPSAAGMPMIMIGTSFRWLGIYVNPSNKVGIKYNNNNFLYSNTFLNQNQWYSAELSYRSNTVTLTIDGVVVLSSNIGALVTGNDKVITTTDFSSGQALNGCIRNLQVLNGAPPSGCGVNVFYNAPVGTDNCPGAATTLTSGLASGAYFPVGVTTNTFKVTDASGNSATCSFNVTVVDDLPPVLVDPTQTCSTLDQSLVNDCLGNASNFDATTLQTAVAALYQDNCPGNITAELMNTTAGANNSNCNWSFTYNFKIRDLAGNFVTCSVTRSGGDKIAPSLTGAPYGGTTGTNACKDNAATAAPFSATNAIQGYTDNCGGPVTAVLTNTSVTGTNCAWTVTYTFSVKDECGNILANRSYSNTGSDQTAPVLSGTPYGGITGTNACKDNAATAAPFSATNAIQGYTDNCGGPVTAVLTNTSVTGTNCAWTVTYTFSVKDACGNTLANRSYANKGADLTPPSLTGTPYGGTTGTNACKANAATAAPFNASDAVRGYTDNCGGIVTVVLINTSVTGSDAAWTVTYTFNVKDLCSNTLVNRSYSNTGSDQTGPVITCPLTGMATRNTNPGLCTYKVQGNEFNATATDNCNLSSLFYTLSGATTGTGTSLANISLNRGTTLVSWKATDGAGNSAACSFNVKVNDDQNATDYIIYATSQAKFGENNNINGDVGVTDPKGKAEFKKYDVLNPYKVFAADVNVQTPSGVNNVFMIPATGGPNPPFMPYSGNTSGLSNFTVNVNMTLNGNYKDVTVKKGVTATLTGNNFGKITIEEGATVTFTMTVINMEELNVNKGKKYVNTTNVNFLSPASLKIRNKVNIGEDCRVNVCGPKVTCYVGDYNPDEEKFMVKGDNTWVTANIMIPNGKLQMHGGERTGIMTGWYIIEKLDGDGKYITWNKYDCLPCAPSIVNTWPVAVTDGGETALRPVETKEGFSVKAYPNPSGTDFTILVEGSSNETVIIKVTDMNGIIKELYSQKLKGNTVRIGAGLANGAYKAEIIQGRNRQLVKLLKLK